MRTHWGRALFSFRSHERGRVGAIDCKGTPGGGARVTFALEVHDSLVRIILTLTLYLTKSRKFVSELSMDTMKVKNSFIPWSFLDIAAKEEGLFEKRDLRVEFFSVGRSETEPAGQGRLVREPRQGRGPRRVLRLRLGCYRQARREGAGEDRGCDDFVRLRVLHPGRTRPWDQDGGGPGGDTDSGQHEDRLPLLHPERPREDLALQQDQGRARRRAAQQAEGPFGGEVPGGRPDQPLHGDRRAARLRQGRGDEDRGRPRLRGQGRHPHWKS